MRSGSAGRVRPSDRAASEHLRDIARPGPLSGSGTKDDPYHVEDVDVAIDLLSKDKHIFFQRPDEVATLLDRLHDVVQEAVAKGDDAPPYNLCRVSVPGTSIFCCKHRGIPRLQMPQLTGIPASGSLAATDRSLPRSKKGKVDLTGRFLDHLEAQGYNIGREKRLASHLRVTQEELDGKKVARKMRELDELENVPKSARKSLKPIIVTSDGHIVDGHHGWAVQVGRSLRGDKNLKVRVITIDADILDVLDQGREFCDAMGMPRKDIG